MDNFSSYFLNIVFPSFCSDCLEQKSSHAYYRFTLSEFFSFVPSYDDFTLENCTAFFEEVKKKNKYSTCVKKRRQLASIFSYAIEHADVFTEIPPDFQNIFMEIPLMEPKQEIHPNKVISLPELDKIITYTKNNDVLCMFAIMFAFKTMLRAEELRNLKWSDVIETSDGFALQVCSNEEQRYIFLPEDMGELLVEHLNTLEEAVYIFSKDGSSILTGGALRYRLRKACDVSGIPRYNYNDLRNAGIAYASSQKCPADILAQNINMKKKSHISRLTSLSSIIFPDAAEYTNIIFKTGRKKDKEE